MIEHQLVVSSSNDGMRNTKGPPVIKDNKQPTTLTKLSGIINFPIEIGQETAKGVTRRWSPGSRTSKDERGWEVGAEPILSHLSAITESPTTACYDTFRWLCSGITRHIWSGFGGFLGPSGTTNRKMPSWHITGLFSRSSQTLSGGMF
jgi:hypothetical protein